MANDDIVKFLMPDGSYVSNDPSFDMDEAREEYEGAVEYTGDVGVPHDEFQAQTQVEHAATMNSGQPGVGENAVEDPHKLIPNTGTDAMRIQKEDLEQAKEAGADLTNTSVEDPEPVDSNAAVLAVREARRKAAEELRKAQEKLGDDDAGDPEQPYSKWSTAQLRMEVARRNAERDGENQIDTSSAKKKSDLAKALDEDDDNSGQV